MNKIRLYSSREIINALSRDGFEIARKSKGGHMSMTKRIKSGHLVVTVPMAKKEIPRGTFGNILRQAGLSKDEFQELL